MVQLQALNDMLNNNNIDQYIAQGITKKYFSEYYDEFNFIVNHYNTYNKVPDWETFLAKFNDFEVVEVLEPVKYIIYNLKEEYFEKNIVNENILNKDTDVYQISLTIDDKRVKDILSGILDDLKNDKRSYSILSSSDNNFKKRKVNYNKRILDKKESYTINVFISKSLYKPLKYEIVHILNNDVKSYSYEGSLSVGTIYCIDNGTIKYIGSTTINDKSITIKFSDYLKNDVGILKYEKGVNSSNLNLLFNNGTKSYDLVISSKFVNYNKKNKSYINSISSSFKVTDKKIVVVSGNVKIDNKVSSVVKIDEDTTGAILNSKLSNVAVSKKKNLYNNLRARYEKNE